jgi:hypothetical protein
MSLIVNPGTNPSEIERKEIASIQTEAPHYYIQELTPTQIEKRDRIIAQEYEHYPITSLEKDNPPEKLESITFSSLDVSNFLTPWLQDKGILEAEPYLIGGAAGNILSDPRNPLEFADVDICYYLKVPAYHHIKEGVIDFLIFRCQQLQKEKGKIYPFLKLEPKERNKFIEATYLYRKTHLTNASDLVVGSFIALGNIELKFLFDNKTLFEKKFRQNLALSDGFRVSLKGKKVFCVNDSTYCSEEEYQNALTSLNSRMLVIKNPDETTNLTLRLIHKMTQGFFISQQEVTKEALKQFNKEFLLEANFKELASRLHHHQKNHYYENSTGKLFDFIHLMQFVFQLKNEPEQGQVCKSIALAWHEAASENDRNDLIGQFVSLILKKDMPIKPIITLFQGVLVDQWLKGEPGYCAYLFDFDPKKIHPCIAKGKNYLNLESNPVDLAVDFLTVWMEFEKTHPTVLNELSTLLFKENIHFPLQNSKEKNRFVNNIISVFENRHLRNVLELFPIRISQAPLFEFIQKRMPGILPPDKLEAKLLDLKLQAFLEACKHLRIKGLDELIKLILDYTHETQIDNLKIFLELLRAIDDQKAKFNINIVPAFVTKSLVSIIQKAAQNIDLDLLMDAQSIIFLLRKLEFFSNEEVCTCAVYMLEPYGKLISPKNPEVLTKICINLIEFQKISEKTKTLEIELQKLLELINKALLPAAHRLLSKLTSSPEYFKMAYDFLRLFINRVQEPAKNDFATAKWVFETLTGHALFQKSSRILRTAGEIFLQMHPKFFPAITPQILELIELLWSVDPKQTEKGKSLEVYHNLGFRIFDLIHNPQDFHETIVSKLAENLFNEKESNFACFNIHLKAFCSFKDVPKDLSVALQALDIRKDIKKCQIEFIKIILNFDLELGSKIFSKFEKHIRGTEEILSILISKKAELEKNDAFLYWQSRKNPPSAITVDLLRQYVESQDDPSGSKINALVESLLASFKTYSEKKHLNEIVEIALKSLLKDNSLFSIQHAEAVCLAAYSHNIFTKEQTFKTVRIILERYKHIGKIPSKQTILKFQSLFLGLYNSTSEQTESTLGIVAIIEECLTNKEHYFLALDTFKKAISADLFNQGNWIYFNKLCSRLFDLFPSDYKDKRDHEKKIEELISLIEAKKIISAGSPEQIENFLLPLLNIHNLELFLWVWREFKKLPVRDVDKTIVFLSTFFLKGVESGKTPIIHLLHDIFASSHLADHNLCILLLEGFSKTSERSFFEIIESQILKFLNSSQAPKHLSALGYFHIFVYLNNLSQDETEVSALSKYASFIEKHLNEVLQHSQNENHKKISKTYLISLYAKLKKPEQLLSACKMLLEPPVDTSGSLAHILSGLISLEPSKEALNVQMELGKIIKQISDKKLFCFTDEAAGNIFRNLTKLCAREEISDRIACLSFSHLLISSGKTTVPMPKAFQADFLNLLKELFQLNTQMTNFSAIFDLYDVAEEFLQPKFLESFKGNILSYLHEYVAKVNSFNAMSSISVAKATIRSTRQMLRIFGRFDPDAGRKMIEGFIAKIIKIPDDFSMDAHNLLVEAENAELYSKITVGPCVAKPAPEIIQKTILKGRLVVANSLLPALYRSNSAESINDLYRLSHFMCIDNNRVYGPQHSHPLDGLIFVFKKMLGLIMQQSEHIDFKRYFEFIEILFSQRIFSKEVYINAIRTQLIPLIVYSNIIKNAASELRPLTKVKLLGKLLGLLGDTDKHLFKEIDTLKNGYPLSSIPEIIELWDDSQLAKIADSETYDLMFQFLINLTVTFKKVFFKKQQLMNFAVSPESFSLINDLREIGILCLDEAQAKEYYLLLEECNRIKSSMIVGLPEHLVNF